MKILIANLGSTSFKYRLFDVSAETDTSGDERELARGGVERIGSQESRVYASLDNEAAQVNQIETIQPIPDHGVALEAAITQLTAEGGPLSSIADVAAIGFKAVWWQSGGVVANHVLMQWKKWLTLLQRIIHPTSRP